MRNAIGGLGDRLLSLVVPKSTASASCAPNPWTETCYCRNHTVYVHTCRFSPTCKKNCDGCYATDIGC